MIIDQRERNTYAFATIEEHIPRVDTDTDMMICVVKSRLSKHVTDAF